MILVGSTNAFRIVRVSFAVNFITAILFTSIRHYMERMPCCRYCFDIRRNLQAEFTEG